MTTGGIRCVQTAPGMLPWAPPRPFAPLRGELTRQSGSTPAHQGRRANALLPTRPRMAGAGRIRFPYDTGTLDFAHSQCISNRLKGNETMTLIRAVGLAGLATAGLATALWAESHVDKAITAAVGTRHAHMTLYSHNLGIVGAMAKGETEYDAAAATAAAGNLVALARIDEIGYWPEGSDTSVEGSRALPAIWENLGDIQTLTDDLATKAEALQSAAGTDLAALQAAVGPVGAACGACHEKYRQPK